MISMAPPLCFRDIRPGEGNTAAPSMNGNRKVLRKPALRKKGQKSRRACCDEADKGLSKQELNDGRTDMHGPEQEIHRNKNEDLCVTSLYSFADKDSTADNKGKKDMPPHPNLPRRSPLVTPEQSNSGRRRNVFGPMGCGHSELDLRPPKKLKAEGPVYAPPHTPSCSCDFRVGPVYTPTIRMNTGEVSQGDNSARHSCREHPISRREWDRSFRML